MKVNPRTHEAYQLLHDGILALARAEQAGIRVDVEYVIKKKAQLTYKIEQLERQFKETDLYKHWAHVTRTVNINSNPQLAHFLYDVKKIKPKKYTDSGQGSTDDEALKMLNMPELDLLLEMRKLRKVRDTYLDAFQREQIDGYIHPIFNLHLVRTYRSSSDSPNFQNIPKRDEESMQIVRRALFARPNHQLLEVDFGSLEVRIAACYHKDSTMLHYIRDPKSDMHTDMTKQIFKIPNEKWNKAAHNVLRQATKNGFVFPEFYGDYYKNCAENMACGWGKLPNGVWHDGQGILIGDQPLGSYMRSVGLPSLQRFTTHIQKIEEDFWGNRFKEYAEWKERWWRMYQKYGYVDMLTGFRCSGVMSRNDCINYPVQGAAFHCLLWSFIEVDRMLRLEKLGTRLIGQIHDSMILDVVPSELDYVVFLLRRITTEDLPKAFPWIIVPLEVDIEVCPVNGNWVEKQPFK